MIGALLAEAKCKSKLGDWAAPGGPLQAVANAVAALQAGGNAPPYALVVSPAMYAQLVGLINNGARELEMVEELVKGGIFQYVDENCSRRGRHWS